MLKYLAISCILFLFSYQSKCQSNYPRLFTLNPTLYNDGFTYLLFPFNESFIKTKSVKKIWYAGNKSVDKYTSKYCTEFNRDGKQIKSFCLLLKEGNNQPDTVNYEERIYDKFTGLLDTVIKIDDRPLFTSVSCYYYDEQKRLKEVLNFGFTEQNSPSSGNKMEESNSAEIPFGLSVDSNYKTIEWVDKTSINGRPVDPSAFAVMKRNNDFSSLHYMYYKEGDFLVEKKTELYDFLKRYNDNDTCNNISYYYTSNKKQVSHWMQYDCNSRAHPAEYYIYKNDRLDSIKDMSSQQRDISLNYDSNKNLIGITNIWKEKIVSSMQMKYDKGGLLTSLIRKSESSKADYFMDDEVFFTYEYY